MLDFAIVGWPKCGTSSIYHWLNEHPRIEGSSPKETFYLMDKDHPLINKKNNYHLYGESGLKKYYSDSKGLLKFEATTHTYYQETALKYFREINKNAKLIFITRDPSRRILSSFNYTKENLAVIDEELTFNKYVDLLLNSSSQLDKYFYSDSSLFVAKKELHLSNYTFWINKWAEKIGEERILVLDFKILKKEPLQLISKVGDFVGFKTLLYNNFEFKKKNKTKNITHYSVHRFANKINRILPDIFTAEFLKQFYFKWQKKEGKQFYDYKLGIERLNKYFQR